MKKTLLLIITCLFAFLPLGQNAFGASGDILEVPTIREMQESIGELQQEKNLLEFKWKNFRIGNSSLGELLRKDLSISEKNELSLLVEEFNTKNNAGEAILKKIIENNGSDASQRKALLLLKKDFYTSLKIFVDESKTDKLVEYIGTDLSLDQKSKEVDSQIMKIQNSKNQRVQVLQEKIEDNNKIIRENIENKIRTQVKTKLDAFTTQGDFSNLPSAAKIDVFERVITKLEYESIRLTNLTNSTSVIEEKILVFRVVINLLKQYTSDWSQ